MQKHWPERKSEKEGLFRRCRGAWSGWIGLSAVDTPVGGGACPNSVSRATKRWLLNFSVGPEIGMCGHMGKYFSARLPLEGRSERGAPVGVLFGRNGGCR